MKQPLPVDWTKCQKEIDILLRFYDPVYEQRIYLKPAFYIYDIADRPERYPTLAKLSVKHQKRHISIFLKERGRVPRSKTQGAARVWMIPGVIA